MQFLQADCDFSTHDANQKDRKEVKLKTVDVTFCRDDFWTTAWAFFSKIKSDLIDNFLIFCVFLYNKSIKLKLYVTT